jgi:ABC-type uncharacterized transport system substrate-binding protein
MREVSAAAQALGLEVDPLEIRRPEDIASAFEQLKSGAQALYVCTDALANAIASTSWRWAHGCQQCSACGNTSIRQV